jgi:hypothetical protein
MLDAVCSRRQRADGRGQTAEGRREKEEGRGQGAEGRGQGAEGRGLLPGCLANRSALAHLPTAIAVK